MSTVSSPWSVAWSASTPDEKPPMPKGRCRYILLLPEVKGQRCACARFDHNTRMPGATCGCGHLACFHSLSSEPSADQGSEALLRRIQALEARVDMASEDAIATLPSRMASLEGDLDRHRDEVTERIRGVYNNIALSWRSIEHVERGNQLCNNRHGQLLTRLGAQEQQLRTIQASLSESKWAHRRLEDAIGRSTQQPQDESGQGRAEGRRARRISAPAETLQGLSLTSSCSGPPRAELKTVPGVDRDARRPSISRCSGPPVSACSLTSAPSPPVWIVHISLLPSADMIMPFEKNTAAYQRCFSRGLHQSVAVLGRDSRSFAAAVSGAFDSILRGRAWMPLQAEDCEVDGLQGLPMLRRLEAHMVDADHGYNFLRAHCGILDRSGAIDALYIAMRHHTISWHALRQAPVYHGGLETSWEHNRDLDKDPFDGDSSVDEARRPAAGDITMMVPALKRPAAGMSRYGGDACAGLSAMDGDGDGDVKRARPNTPPGAGMTSPGAEIG